MRNKISVLLISLTAVAAIMFTFVQLKQYKIYDYKDVAIADDVTFPINKAEDAAMYAKSASTIEIQKQSEYLESAVDWEVNWEITTERFISKDSNGPYLNNWMVTIGTANLLPPYTCIVQFTSEGEHIEKTCRGHK